MREKAGGARTGAGGRRLRLRVLTAAGLREPHCAWCGVQGRLPSSGEIPVPSQSSRDTSSKVAVIAPTDRRFFRQEESLKVHSPAAMFTVSWLERRLQRNPWDADGQTRARIFLKHFDL